jgi:hypothetical protein
MYGFKDKFILFFQLHYIRSSKCRRDDIKNKQNVETIHSFVPPLPFSSKFYAICSLIYDYLRIIFFKMSNKNFRAVNLWGFGIAIFPNEKYVMLKTISIRLSAVGFQ